MIFKIIFEHRKYSDYKFVFHIEINDDIIFAGVLPSRIISITKNFDINKLGPMVYGYSDMLEFKSIEKVDELDKPHYFGPNELKDYGDRYKKFEQSMNNLKNIHCVTKSLMKDELSRIKIKFDLDRFNKLQQ